MLETPKAVNAKAKSAKISVNAKKLTDVTMGNQHATTEFSVEPSETIRATPDH